MLFFGIIIAPPIMDAIQERENRIEELKKKKAELLSNGNVADVKKSEEPT